MTTHLVLGATGGIGRATVKALLLRGEEVRILVRDRRKAERYFAGLKPLDVVEGDLVEIDRVKRAALGCVSVYYCVNVPYPQWESDARRFLAIGIDAAVAAGARFIFPGNVYVYGHVHAGLVNEHQPFAAHTKKGKIRVEMEQMIGNASRNRGMKYAIVRMPDFYGPFVVNGFSEKIFLNALEGKTVRWAGSLDAPYETIFIDDGGEAMVAAGLSDASTNRTFNVPGAGETTMRQFLAEVVRQAGSSSSIATVNSRLLIGLAGLFNPVIREFREMMYLKQERLMLDGSLFASTFGTVPCTPYPEGIAKTLAWVKGFMHEHTLK